MTANILNGTVLSNALREGFKQRVADLTTQGHRPGLVVILVGEDPASEVYVRNKVHACDAAGPFTPKRSLIRKPSIPLLF
jgi:methylenetetrahydrofolate dehydrogenase (NADP+)/methenyltetrahydrofolate cyclohydrolase